MKLARNGTMVFMYETEEAVISYRKPSMKGLQELADVFRDAKTEEEAGLMVLEAVISKYFVSWNLEDEEGNTLPVNYINLMEMPSDFVHKVMECWAEAAAGMPLPFDMNSTDLSSLSLGLRNSRLNYSEESSPDP